MTSDMSDTHYHGVEISADTYATLTRHQFNLESLEERLQRMENTTATMKEKWRRGDEAMRDFTGTGIDGSYRMAPKKGMAIIQGHTSHPKAWFERFFFVWIDGESVEESYLHIFCREWNFTRVNRILPPTPADLFAKPDLLCGRPFFWSSFTVERIRSMRQRIRSRKGKGVASENVLGNLLLPEWNPSFSPGEGKSRRKVVAEVSSLISEGMRVFNAALDGSFRESRISHFKAEEAERELFRFRKEVEEQSRRQAELHSRALVRAERRGKRAIVAEMKRRAALFATEFESFKDAQEFVGDFRECRGSVATLYKSQNEDFSFPAEVAEMSGLMNGCAHAESLVPPIEGRVRQLWDSIEVSEDTAEAGTGVFVDCSQRNSGGIVRDLEVQIGNALVPVDFHALDIKLNWNSSLLLGRAFLSTVGAVCNLQTNQLCLTLIDPTAHYDPIPAKKPHTSFRRINDPGFIAACHCGAEYETDYSASIKTHSTTSIDSTHRKSTDTYTEESVDSRPDNWEIDYYNPIMAVNDAPPETPDDPYDEEYRKKGILFHKLRPLRPEIQAQVETDSLLAEACGKGTSFSRISEADRRATIDREIQESIDRENRPSNNIHPTTLIDVDVPTSVNKQPEFGRRAFDSHGTEDFTGKRRISMEFTKMIRDVPEIWMDTSSMCPRKRSES
ncbi:hypothetical protein F2Q70_00021864 [Brassica cretica]|uniref:Uncharacterized protein n=1 Tax=Brassica cretica TaxID=69181 RepID=A0A8S9GWN4_BRACR|nr:hypothetical protein F2Q70_00021864 [Brassica cretica]